MTRGRGAEKERDARKTENHNCTKIYISRETRKYIIQKKNDTVTLATTRNLSFLFVLCETRSRGKEISRNEKNAHSTMRSKLNVSQEKKYSTYLARYDTWAKEKARTRARQRAQKREGGDWLVEIKSSVIRNTKRGKRKKWTDCHFDEPPRCNIVHFRGEVEGEKKKLITGKYKIRTELSQRI